MFIQSHIKEFIVLGIVNFAVPLIASPSIGVIKSVKVKLLPGSHKRSVKLKCWDAFLVISPKALLKLNGGYK